MVSKYRSLVKKSTAVKLKASDYVGLPNNEYLYVRYKPMVTHTHKRTLKKEKYSNSVSSTIIRNDTEQ